MANFLTAIFWGICCIWVLSAIVAMVFWILDHMKWPKSLLARLTVIAALPILLWWMPLKLCPWVSQKEAIYPTWRTDELLIERRKLFEPNEWITLRREWCDYLETEVWSIPGQHAPYFNLEEII